jgi:formylmethanofuran dehydrogenase subunit E
MPIGYRAGLTAMKKLGVEKASNKELYLLCENGPAHAASREKDPCYNSTNYGS